MTTTATNQTNTNTNGNPTGTATGKPKVEMKPADAISKISKILDQLTAGDRKRVLAFFSATDE